MFNSRVKNFEHFNRLLLADIDFLFEKRVELFISFDWLDFSILSKKVKISINSIEPTGYKICVCECLGLTSYLLLWACVLLK